MTTLTATTAADELLADVRQMLARHDGAESLDELRELADELSTRSAPSPRPNRQAHETRASG